jgi:hypothetical protein
MATAWGQQKVEIQSPSVAVKRGGIAPNAPSASTTRRSEGLISGGFSASIGVLIQKSLRRCTSPRFFISTLLFHSLIG